MNDRRDRRLMAHGFLLILAALVIGLFMQRLPSPRMGLATHLEALMLGMLLLVFGLAWRRLVLPKRALTLLAWLPIVGADASVAMHLFAALFPAGGTWMPLAAPGVEGAPWQELLVSAGMYVIGVTMVPAMALALWGVLRREPASGDDGTV